MPPNDYQYDVFFSYRRHSLTLDWTRGVHRRLQFWLDQEVGRATNLFVDEDSIETGDRWPDRLGEALRASRCMVCVWSPSYFQSDWCVSEWRSFLAREARLGLKSHGLIAPLKFHDGEHFPPDAQAIQWTDVSLYSYTAPAFWTSQRAIELEDLLKAFAHSVATIIRSAPEFETDWPVVDVPAPRPTRIDLARL